MDSVILPEGVKEKILQDIDEFLKAERWYVDRGIPHRRGYLLSGVPGSGKTSLITALAGHLSLDLYVVNLSQKGLDDVALNDLWNSVPEGSLLLMEDLDCAFGSRIPDEMEEGTNKWGETIKRKKNGKMPPPLSSVSLAGILNSLDGVSAQSGSIVFATTNHVDRLDPALRRPGRMDVHLEFEYATRAQARDLFLHFYPSKSFHDERLEEWADAFAGSIPEKVSSIASLQGFLMDYKTDPAKAAADVISWIERTTEIEV